MQKPLRVLVVEDEWLIAEDHATNLTMAGHLVVGPVPSVREALLLIENESIDAAMLDITLNGENSYPVAEALLSRNVPFLFLSGYVRRDLPQHLSRYRIISKPSQPQALMTALEELVGES